MSSSSKLKFDIDLYQQELAYLVNIDSSSSEPVGSDKVADFFKNSMNN